jgi:hypothetical protein
LKTILAAALWNHGREDEARHGRENTGQPPPSNRQSLGAGIAYRHQKDLDALVTPLRLAGLPE